MGGANLVVLATAISLPLSNLSFGVRSIMGPFYDPFKGTDAAALACSIVGFSVHEKLGKTTVEEESEGRRACEARCMRALPCASLSSSGSGSRAEFDE